MATLQLNHFGRVDGQPSKRVRGRPDESMGILSAVHPPDRPLRILQVITDTDRRGAQVFAVDLGAQLEQLGHTVTTTALTAGTTTPHLDVATLGRRARGLRTLRALRRAMATVDITIAHGSSTLLACAVAGLGPGRPFVYRQIGDSRFWAAPWHRRWRVAGYLRHATHVVALSDGAGRTLTEYLKLPAGRISVVPNGVRSCPLAPTSDVSRRAARSALGLPDDGVVVVYIGALATEKGVDTAIEAVAELPAMRLVVCGDGPQRWALEQLAQRVAPGRVHFVGVRSDVSDVYAAADVLVLSSKGGESMPAVLIEAGLAGLPTVACPIGAIEDVVVDGETGLIVPVNDVAALATALDRLAADPAMRERLGRAARLRCLQRFTIDVVAEQWSAVLSRAYPRQSCVS